MKKKLYTIVCVCCCGCDENEIHFVSARTPSEATKRKVFHNKRIVAVFDGAHYEARLRP